MYGVFFDFQRQRFASALASGIMAGMNSSPAPDTPRASPDDTLLQLALEKKAISTRLTAVVMVLYFGFIGLLAFAPQVLAGRVGSATLGIPLGIGLIFVCWLLTGIYVRWANTRYDSLAARIRSNS